METRIKRNRTIGLVIVSAISFLLVSSCGMETVSAAKTTEKGTTNYPANTKAEVTPSKALTATLSATNTWVPSRTPTSGPPPDLELVDVSIYRTEKEVSIYNNFILLGRVRNNSDKIMIFNYNFVPFKFTFERWDFEPNQQEYFHDVTEDAPEMGYDPDHNRLMNCFLYPGEEGVIVLKTPSPYAKRINFQWTKEHDAPLGIWFTYESFYQVQPDLRLDWHPKAEELKFSNINSELIFDYDVAVPELTSHSFATLKSWTILFDRNDKIINVLFKNLEGLGGVTPGSTLHVHGTTATPISDLRDYFIPAIELTPEMIQQVNRIEVFIEQEDGDICRRKN